MKIKTKKIPYKVPEYLPFGQYKGKPLRELPTDYIEFLLDQDWFNTDKWIPFYIELEDILEKRESLEEVYIDEEGN